MTTRWDKWFADDNLAQDERILAAPPSQSAEHAARAFLARKKRFILDLACGIGRDTFYLARRGLAVVGADSSCNGLQVAGQVQARPGAAVLGLVAADARRLPFRDGAFEGVYCFGLLHEFTGENRENDVKSVMDDARRVLGAGGVIVLTVLAGEPETGLPHVQFYTRQMFDDATQALRALDVRVYNDVGCTGRPDYKVWYGLFET